MHQAVAVLAEQTGTAMPLVLNKTGRWICTGERGRTGEVHLLDDQTLQHQLAISTLQQAALHAVGSGHSEYQDRPGLPNPMCSVHCLHCVKEGEM